MTAPQINHFKPLNSSQAADKRYSDKDSNNNKDKVLVSCDCTCRLCEVYDVAFSPPFGGECIVITERERDRSGTKQNVNGAESGGCGIAASVFTTVGILSFLFMSKQRK